MTNTVVGTKVCYAGDDSVTGTIASVETHDPEGNELAEEMIWVQWPDMDDLDLLTWDDVIEVGTWTAESS
jgi:hypothetical protein